MSCRVQKTISFLRIRAEFGQVTVYLALSIEPAFLPNTRLLSLSYCLNHSGASLPPLLPHRPAPGFHPLQAVLL